MAVLIFKLYNVPEDEAEDVRALLDEYRLDYYETSAGRWRLGVDALWLKNNEDAPRARELLARYQQERSRLAREKQEQLKEQGLTEHFLSRLLMQPGQALLTFLGILAVLFIFFLPLAVLLGSD